MCLQPAVEPPTARDRLNLRAGRSGSHGPEQPVCLSRSVENMMPDTYLDCGTRQVGWSQGRAVYLLAFRIPRSGWLSLGHATNEIQDNYQGYRLNFGMG